MDLNDLKTLILRVFAERIISIVIFGSYAKGLSTPESDIDILLILEDKVNYEDYEKFFLKIEMPLTEKYGLIKLSPVIRCTDNISEKTSILWDESNIILYDKDNFFSNIISKIKDLKENNSIIGIQFPNSHYLIRE